MEDLDYPICILKMDLKCCEDFPSRVKRRLRKVNGVYAIIIDPAKGLILVSGTAEPPVLIKAIEKLGQSPKLYAYEKDSAKAKTQFRSFLKRYATEERHDEQATKNGGTCCPVGGEAVRGGFGYPTMMQMPMFTLPRTMGPPGWLAPGERPRLRVRHEQPEMMVRKLPAPYPFDFYESKGFPAANSLYHIFSDDNANPLHHHVIYDVAV